MLKFNVYDLSETKIVDVLDNDYIQRMVFTELKKE